MGHNVFTDEFGMGFLSAFLSALCVIVVSEIGDKTFFIAAIFSMKYSRLVVYLGAMFALVLMTVLSALLGYATSVIPHWITHYLSAVLFIIFGLKMLYEAYRMDPNQSQNEFESVKCELEDKEKQFVGFAIDHPTKEKDVETGPILPQPPTSSSPLHSTTAAATSSSPPHSPLPPPLSSSSPQPPSYEACVESRDSVVTPVGKESDEKKRWKKFISLVSPVFLQSFILTFVAEWGDRSQLSTVILATQNNLIGVVVGGVIGHALCTGCAVLAGRFVAQRISLRTVHIIGAIVFFLSAIYILCFEE
ncbi:hypothetical protein HELRODRAFT_159649 [Helobdella robusta]|uniref:GDT1 family protein n=1 Tax=Helobdella robusta TaxID=6412 RepID=T1EPA0_HELRO|nr:hypothetical protein HELRODRAFT_159649 [Helobdella robusta]ESO13051.1 hypothetical protein HELRODRAFT_159649 [Helobdella robusta]